MNTSAEPVVADAACAASAQDQGFFEVGYEPMDSIHREFHDLLAQLARADADEGQALLALHEHLLRHCAQEEQWMRDSNFPACACHQREHDMVLEVVAEVRRRVDAGDAQIGKRLAAELAQWFSLHANAMDAGLAYHLRNIAAGTPPALAAGTS